MAQEPYSPVPNVVESLPPTPLIHVDTPPAAFGANIGEALVGAGKETTQASDELFTRAIAMQEVHNIAMARDASIQSSQKMAQLWADFESKEGKNASPEALQEFYRKINQVRQDTLNSLPNPMARQHYDEDAAGAVTRFNIYAASHAGQQLKIYHTTTLESEREHAINNGESNPGDERQANKDKETIRKAEVEIGKTKGLSPETVEENIRVHTSRSVLARLTGLTNKGDIEGAERLFDQAKRDHDFWGGDNAKAEELIRRAEEDWIPKKTVEATRSGANGAMGDGKVDIERSKDAMKKATSGGVYDMTAKDGALGAYHLPTQFFKDRLKAAGYDPNTTVQQFLADPHMQDKVYETFMKDAIETYGSHNKAVDQWLYGKEGAKDSKLRQEINKHLYESAPDAEKASVTRKLAEGTAKHSPDVGDRTERKVVSEEATKKAVSKNDQLTYYETALDAIERGHVTTMDGLKEFSPEAAIALNNMDPITRDKIQRRVDQAARNDDTHTNLRDTNATTLRGMAFGEEQAKFADLDLTSFDLTASQRRQLEALQRDIRQGKAVDDPHMHYATGNRNITEKLAKLGFQRGSDEYNAFYGRLETLIRIAREARQGKALSFAEIDQLANTLLAQVSNPKSGWWGPRTVPRMQLTPSAEEAETIRRDNPDKELTDDQVQEIFTIRRAQEALAAEKAREEATKRAKEKAKQPQPKPEPKPPPKKEETPPPPKEPDAPPENPDEGQ